MQNPETLALLILILEEPEKIRCLLILHRQKLAQRWAFQPQLSFSMWLTFHSLKDRVGMLLDLEKSEMKFDQQQSSFRMIEIDF